MYRILSIDGGGIYGTLSAVILERLDLHTNFLSKTDLIAGTSIGGIIALGLAYEMSPESMVIQFSTRSSDIFPTSLQTLPRRLVALIGLRAKYCSRGRESVLQDLFKNVELKDLAKKVVIPAFEIDNDLHQWRTIVFHNFENIGDVNEAFHPHITRHSRGQLVYTVGMATSAAPVYFPTTLNWIDGGVAENNPSMAAVMQTQDRHCLLDPRPSLDEIKLLSIGNGVVGECVENQSSNEDLGWIRWAPKIISMLMHGPMSTTDYQCRQLLRSNYHRVYPLLPQNLDRGMDDISLVPDLIEYGDQMDLTDTMDWLEKNW